MRRMHASDAHGSALLTCGRGTASQLLHALDTCGRTAPACVLHSSNRSVTRLGHTLTPFPAAQ